MSLSAYCPVSSELESVKHYAVHTFNSINELDTYQWERFVPETNRLMHTDYLGMLEGTHNKEMRFKYAVVKKDDITLGILYFQVVYFKAGQLINYFPKGDSVVHLVLKKLSSAVLGSINANLLVSGNVFMTGENGFFFKNEIDAETRGKLVRKAINEICRTDHSIDAILISDLYEPRSEFDTGFLPSGYHKMIVESDMSITLKKEWNSFDAYLQSLSSKYRVRARKVYSMCKENDVTTIDLTAQEIEKHTPRIYDLYKKVLDKADFKLASLSQEYFKMQKELMPEQYRLFAYFKDDIMIGFISAFVVNKRMEVHYVGMDHDLCRPIHLYQHMMYDMISLGISQLVQKLHFGRTAPEIKSTIGAVPSEMYGYLKHRNPLFNFLLVKPYTTNLKPKNYTLRNPFKD